MSRRSTKQAQVATSIRIVSVGSVPTTPQPGVGVRTFGCDTPPKLLSWVGRAEEIKLLSEREDPAVVISGMGGQGKSYLAAKYINLATDPGASPRYELWDWRDCKEGTDRLHSKLIQIVERLTNGKVSADALSAFNVDQVINTLFDVLGQRRVVFVFDNIDGYVDLEAFQPILGMKSLFDAVLGRAHASKFIFTCRPDINMDRPGCLGLPISGLDLGSTMDLFARNGADVKQDDIQRLVIEAHKLTSGHPMWLAMIASQRVVAPSVARKLMGNLRQQGKVQLPKTMLQTLWADLKQEQTEVLKMLAETIRAHSDRELAKMLKRGKLGLTKTRHLLEGLARVHLIIEKDPTVEGDPQYELHPLIREFIRGQHSPSERKALIAIIIEFFYDPNLDRAKRLLRPAMGRDGATLLTEKAELLHNKGDPKTAVETLAELSSSAVSVANGEEFVRVAKLVLEGLDWDQAVEEEIPGFHRVIGEVAFVLSHHGRDEESARLLDRYSLSICTGPA